MTNIDKQAEDNFQERIIVVKVLSDLQDRAVVEYTPLVDDICSRKATKDEVDYLLTWMLDFVENVRYAFTFQESMSCIFLYISGNCCFLYHGIP